MLEHDAAVDPERNGRFTFLNWTSRYGSVYEIHIYLVSGGRNRPGTVLQGTSKRTRTHSGQTAPTKKIPNLEVNPVGYFRLRAA